MSEHNFEFLTTESITESLSNYTEKPILLKWAASWCGVCKLNQNNMKLIYDDYKENVTFITISYGGSNDDLDNVQWMKDRGPYDWLFGLDFDDYASTVGAVNGHMWILNADLTLYQKWGKSIVPIGDLRTTLNGVIGPIVTQISSETTSVSCRFTNSCIWDAFDALHYIK